MAPKLSKHRVAANEDGHSLVSLNAPCCDRHWGTDFEDSESSYLFRKMDVFEHPDTTEQPDQMDTPTVKRPSNAKLVLQNTACSRSGLLVLHEQAACAWCFRSHEWHFKKRITTITTTTITTTTTKTYLNFRPGQARLVLVLTLFLFCQGFGAAEHYIGARFWLESTWCSLCLVGAMTKRTRTSTDVSQPS